MTMKKLTKTLLIISLLGFPAIAFSQMQDTLYYKKKTKRTTTGTTAEDVIRDTINKGTGPILNDNGTISTNGTINGRSSTGRDLDTLNNYKVRKKKNVKRTGDPASTDTTRRKRNRP
jgi:hypothetical protein